LFQANEYLLSEIMVAVEGCFHHGLQ